MLRTDLREIAKHFDLEKIEDDLNNPKPAFVPVSYLEMDRMLYELTGLYLEELVEKLANGWKLVLPEEGDKK